MTGVPHLGFIVAAYAVTAIVIAAMIAAILWDYRSLKSQLGALEAARRDRPDARP